MKKIMKRRIAAALAALMAVSVCTVFAGCGSGSDTTTENSTPLATLPSETTTENPAAPTETTTGSTSVETTTGTPSVIPPLTGDYTNPLTGEPTNNNVSNTRPIAIVVDNNATALGNQTGLDQADILYETLVAPGITRFLAVYSDYTKIDSVCNIRSGRDYHLDMAAFHNAVLICHGASNTENYDFYQLAVERLGSRYGFVDTQQEYYFNSAEAGVKYGTLANYGDRVDLKYDTLFKADAFEALLSSSSSKFVGSMNGYAKESLKFVPYGTTKDLTGASSATEVNLSFECQGAAGSKNVSFKYDAATDKYLRYQAGVKHVDSETGKQLSFTNVITLLTTVECVDTGIANDPYMTLVQTKSLSGLGYYFYGGKVIQISWHSDGDTLTLIDALGNNLTLATGNTYIGFLDSKLISGGTSFWN